MTRDERLAAIQVNQKRWQAMWCGISAMDVGYLLARIETLERALRQLHDNTADYVRLNNLGDPYQNQDMRDARVALQASEEA